MQVLAKGYFQLLDTGTMSPLKKTNIMAQDASVTPCISINDHMLEVVEVFTYLGSKISNNLSLDADLNTRIGKASTAMARLSKRVWENTMLTINTKMRVYQACVLSILSMEARHGHYMHIRNRD